MKKILVTLVSIALLLMLSCALAEEVPAINWEDVHIEDTGIEGSWYTLNAVAVQFWVPDLFENKDITEDDDESMVAKFELPDGTAGIYAQYIEGFEGATIDDLVASIESNNGKDAERCTLNGLDTVSYSIPDVDAVYVAFVTESGNYLQFIFTPVSDEKFAAVAQLVTASIMPEE